MSIATLLVIAKNPGSNKSLQMRRYIILKFSKVKNVLVTLHNRNKSGVICLTFSWHKICAVSWVSRPLCCTRGLQGSTQQSSGRLGPVTPGHIHLPECNPFRKGKRFTEVLWEHSYEVDSPRVPVYKICKHSEYAEVAAIWVSDKMYLSGPIYQLCN